MNISRTIKPLIIDVALAEVAVAVAMFMGRGFSIAETAVPFMWRFVPVMLVVGFILHVTGVGRSDPRYVGGYDVRNLALASVGAALVGVIINVVVGNVTPAHLVLSPTLTFALCATLLVGRRVIHQQISWSQTARARGPKAARTLIVGAGDAGEIMVLEMARSTYSAHIAIGFVDDNPDKKDLQIHGVPVLGTLEQIPDIARRYDIDEILIAIPSANGDQIRRINELCAQTGARLRTLPPVAEVLGKLNQLPSTVREVEIEDLLRRKPAETNIAQIGTYISGETVLISGGGGSIGSELARQIAKLNPARLLLMGKGENSIFEIEQELVQTGFKPQCIIGDIRDRDALELLFKEHHPTVVFHAAAHKHVPLMEANILEAVKNNVKGTLNMAEISAKYGVRKFVNISTDKAVNPGNVMGATKRVGELIVRSIAQRSETEFAVVRFGNVLGSRGSLVPMLKKQIRQGGPVRLTHPEMTRFFMTIPEAVALILQAGAIGHRGELFILDMGEPIKIVDLAYDLIRLHGLEPNVDIPVQFMGPRPGEKLHEELVYDQEQLQPTVHPKIRMAGTENMNPDALLGEVRTLVGLAETGQKDQAESLLKALAHGKTQVPFQYAATDVASEKPSSLSVD